MAIRDKASPVTQRPPISTSPDVPRMKAGGHSPASPSFLRAKVDSSPWGTGTAGGGECSDKGPSPTFGGQRGFGDHSPSFGRSGSRASSQSELSRSTSFPRVGLGVSSPLPQKGLPRPVPTRRASVDGRARSTSMPLPPKSELNPTDKAVECVQRCIRRWKAKKHGRSILALWPSLDQIRSLYFDEAAIAAGARDNPLYSDEALVAREALRTAPLVVDALEYVAEACLGPASEGNTMGRDAYLAMSRKLYLVLRMAGEEELDPAECARLMERDWAADSGGRGFIERQQITDAWFQLADLHTSEVSASQYAGWLRQTLDDIAALHAGAFGRGLRMWEWKPDSEIIAHATRNGASVGVYQRMQWGAAFEVQHKAEAEHSRQLTALHAQAAAAEAAGGAAPADAGRVTGAGCCGFGGGATKGGKGRRPRRRSMGDIPMGDEAGNFGRWGRSPLAPRGASILTRASHARCSAVDNGETPTLKRMRTRARAHTCTDAHAHTCTYHMPHATCTCHMPHAHAHAHRPRSAYAPHLSLRGDGATHRLTGGAGGRWVWRGPEGWGAHGRSARHLHGGRCTNPILHGDDGRRQRRGRPDARYLRDAGGGAAILAAADGEDGRERVAAAARVRPVRAREEDPDRAPRMRVAAPAAQEGARGGGARAGGGGEGA